MDESEQLEQAIAALEAQRAVLGDPVVDAALAPMREKLAALQKQYKASETQRKQVTVLFADVSGFTAMAELMDPEEVSETMNALWTRLDAAITHRGGLIDKHIGDAVMALFGTPIAQEDDPERAIRAALTMQSELRAFAEESRRRVEGAPQLAMRIGINTGPVLLGAVGSTGEYTAMGDTVNVASRLEHAAPVGGILISHDTYRHVRGVFDVVSLEPISVKGKSEPIQVYRVQAAKPRAFRVTTRGVEGIETRTIGREAELRQMQAAMNAARDRRATQLVSLVAEAGVGKSRLLYEFNNWLELQPERTLLFKGRSTQQMATLPYSLIRNVLAFRFEIQDSDPAPMAREKLQNGFVKIMGAAGGEAAHFIGHLIGFDFSSSPFLQGILGDARQIRDRAFHYAAEFFSALTREHAAALMLEDIHWADDGSLDLIDHVMRERPDLPLLVVALTRPLFFERRPNWGGPPIPYVRLDLRPLSEEDSRQLVAEILRKVAGVPQALQDLIVRRAEGSPFYVEELIKMLIEDGVIVTGADRWQVNLDRLAAVRVPATLVGVLQARLDGLPQHEREILQQASIVGRVFWGSVVERLYRVFGADAARREPATATRERLSGLHKKELVFKHEESAFSETQEYIFKHAILHDVTYESVLKRLRRAYHAEAAGGLIELSGERANEYAGRIGEHLERAEEWGRAAEWYARAGKQARDTYAPEAAIGYYQKALAFWQKDAPAHGTQATPPVEVYEGLGEVLAAQARYAEAIEIYTAMRQAAESTGDSRTQSRAWYGLAMTQGNQGDHHAALSSAAQAEAAAQAAGATVELAMALLMKGRGLFRLGDLEAALAMGEQMWKLTIEAGERRLMARSLNLLGAAHNMLGHYAEAERYFEQALRVGNELGDRRQVMDLLNNLGVIAEARGDYRTAFRCYQDALHIAREIGDRDGEMVFLSNRGGAGIGLEAFEAAEADLRQVIEMAGPSGAGGLSDTFRFLAEACLGQGKVEEALVAAQQALTLGQSIQEPAFVAAAWRALGRVAASMQRAIAIEDRQAGQPQMYDAPACFTESLHICSDMGMEGERARTLRAWASYELDRGDLRRGAAMWQEAREIFVRIGADLEAQQMADAPVP